jgi:hypothetical protein
MWSERGLSGRADVLEENMSEAGAGGAGGEGLGGLGASAGDSGRRGEGRANSGRWNTHAKLYKDAWAGMWRDMPESGKLLVKEIPNFDPEIFFEITGIEV